MTFSLRADDLQKFSNATLSDNPSNDGDSFSVKIGTRVIRLRLYFADCPETSFNFKSDAQRLKEQTRYFGLKNTKQTLYFGKQAEKFIEENLERPFTVNTAFAKAMGRSERVYGFVTTAKGKDLASLLIKNGFARARGMGRKTPYGLSRNDMFKKLRDLEISAMLKRTGIWSESDPDKLVALREKQRAEDENFSKLKRCLDETPQSGLININTANKKELISIKGIGPVLADRIILKRPFANLDDLLKIKGIGKKKLEKMKPRISLKN